MIGFGETLAGLGWLAAVLGASGAASAVLLRRAWPGLRGVARAVAGAVLLTSVVIAAHVVPLAAGALSVPAVIAAALAAWALARRAPTAGGSGSPPAGRPGGPPLVAALLLAAVLLGGTGAALAEPSRHDDYMTFHLPVVVGWIQEGTLWRADGFQPGLFSAFYPHNGDVLALAVTLPWRTDALVRPLFALFAALTVLALVQAAREAGASGRAAWAAAVPVGAMPAVALIAALTALPDAVCLFGLAAGGAALLRHARTRATPDAVLAGLALGLAAGTKWYGLPAAGLLGLAWVVAARPPARALGAAALAAAPLGGVWLVRNLVVGGNPLLPLGLPGLASPPDPVRAELGTRLVDYAGSPRTLWEIGGDVAELMTGAVGPLLLAGAVVVAAVGGRRERLLLGLTAALLAVYACLPFSALGRPGEPVLAWVNARYGLPALLVAAVLCALGLDRLRGRARLAAEAALVLAVADALRRTRLATLPEALAGAAVLGALLATARHVPRTPAAAVLALAAVALGLHAQQRAFLDGRYAGLDPALDWIAREVPADGEVVLAGTFSRPGLGTPLAVAGPRLERRVRYLGRLDEDGAYVALRDPGEVRRALAGVDAVLAQAAPADELARTHLRLLAGAGWRVRAQGDGLAALTR